MCRCVPREGAENSDKLLHSEPRYRLHHGGHPRHAIGCLR